MFGICKEGSLMFPLKPSRTYEQAELFTMYTYPTKLVEVYFLGGGTFKI